MGTPYHTFAHDATFAPPVSYYDYIVIGGGTSGCALAATLSDRATVLLLERGDLPYGNPTINNIATFGVTLSDVSPNSPAQQFISTDGVINVRPRVLGGGSCLNAGFYTRAESDFVQRAGWNPQLVNESYKWVERKIVFRPPMLEWQSAVKDGGGVTLQRFTYDHINGTKFGGTIFDHDGHRHTAADLLEYADPRRIKVYLKATVQRIIFASNGQPRPRATGVEFRDARGNMHKAFLNKGSLNEIILSAGALGSPQLLMLSEVLLDQPMVGQGMSDNPMNGIVIPSPRRVEISLIQVVGITRFGSYIEAASGSITDHIGPHGFAQFLEMFANRTGLNDTMLPDKANQFPSRSANAGIILEKVTGPLSTGHLELQSRDPSDNPRVTFNYFQDPQDLQRCVQGMRTVIELCNTKMISSQMSSCHGLTYHDIPCPGHRVPVFLQVSVPWVSVETLISLMLGLPVNVRPRHLSAAFSLEQFCIDTVMTIWHYHGGCQVRRVVDQNYRVIGVDGLRVIDGSTFDSSPGTNPQATVMMLGRYMGQRILRQRFRGGKK
ncbi:unnamed protein product [Thlaspi arvense]|uniref:Glucose-methanol-choline oxidoreductase N-terminal domain-containing protein n=1 Tax=Thlaspi arvense TaxID=13288 RepID=A0AAU9T6A8_THLAR|nr:unnamed protein product [Thlaspi arvense]